MKLNQYIKESTVWQNWDLLNKKLSKKYDIKDKDIEIARKVLSKKHKVSEKLLNFAFIWELMENRVSLTFNIEDKNHKSYKSSIAYTWLPIEKRGK